MLNDLIYECIIIININININIIYI